MWGKISQIFWFLVSMVKQGERNFYREQMLFKVICYKALSYFNLNRKSEETISTRLGQIRGTIEKDIHGKKYYSFQGIPYAKPPIGNLRFKPPEPAQPWQEIFDATKPGKESLQRDIITKKKLGEEDCLNLNVFTPELPKENEANKLKPVMVFIHGGAFVSGSNSKEIYGPDFLITEDIVLVTINYRLGVLGFLSFDDPSLNSPGNTAFKDMILALKWVQTNITDYNGDPNNVTIFGESAGSASVHLLMLSPITKGLFHKAIAQSGCSLNGWSHRQKDVPFKIAKYLDLKLETEKDIYDYLVNAPIDEIVRAQDELLKHDVLGNQFRFAGWVLEKPSKDAFLTKSPVEIITSGEYHHVPVMMGYNSCEGMLFEILVKKHLKDYYWKNKEINVPAILNLEQGSELSKSLGEKIVNYYLGEGPYTVDTHTLHMYEITTDNCFLWGIYQSVRNHAKFSSSPVYLYKFSVESRLNFYKILSKIKTPGVAHADDLGYLFKTIFTLSIKPGSIEDITQRRICRLWSNFAKTGNPTPENDELLQIDWKPVTKDDVYFLNIEENLNIEKNPEPERMAFWNDVYALHPETAKLL